jgi:hypothetical protein
MKRRWLVLSLFAAAACAGDAVDPGADGGEDLGQLEATLPTSTIAYLYRTTMAFPGAYGTCASLGGSWSSGLQRCWSRWWIGYSTSYTSGTCYGAGGVWANSRCWFREGRAPAGTFNISTRASVLATGSATGAVCMGASDYGVCSSFGGTLVWNGSCWQCRYSGTLNWLQGLASEYGNCTAMGGKFSQHYRCFTRGYKVDLGYMSDWYGEYGNCQQVGGSWGAATSSGDRRCWHRHY